MKNKIKYVISLLIMVLLMFIPFTIHSQTKKVINLSDDEVNKWLGISKSSNENVNNNPYNNIDNYSSRKKSNINDVKKSLSFNGDEQSYADFTNKLNSSNSLNDMGASPRNSQTFGKAANNPFFKGINQIRPVRNEYVDSYIDYFTNNEVGREWVRKSLRHFEFYFPVFRSQLKFEGLPLELMVIPFVETGYNNEVVVNPGETGLWQLTEEEARRYNLEIDDYIDERKDYEKSTKAAVLELKKLNSKVGGNWDLTVMAWAIGDRNLIKTVNQYGTKDVWKLYAAGAFGNSKKKAFLAHFYALLDIIVNAEHYGFDPPRFVKGIPYNKVIMNKAVELERMEQDMKLHSGIMYAYNPQLKKRVTPPNYKNFLLKFPADSELKRDFEIQASIYNNMPDNVIKYEPEIKVMETPNINESTPLDFSGYNKNAARDLIDTEISMPYSKKDVADDIVSNYEEDYTVRDRAYLVSSKKDDSSEDCYTCDDDEDYYNILVDPTKDESKKDKDEYDFDWDSNDLLYVEDTKEEDYYIVDSDLSYDREKDIDKSDNRKDTEDFELDYSLKDSEDIYSVKSTKDNIKPDKKKTTLAEKPMETHKAISEKTRKHRKNDIEYMIKPGDTLWGIHKKFGLPYQVIAYYNNIENPNKIFADTKLYIPTGIMVDSLIAEMEGGGKRSNPDNTGTTAKVSEEDEYSDYKVDIKTDEVYEVDLEYSAVDEEEVVSEKESVITPEEKISEKKDDEEHVIYIVRKGDTLISIANRFNVTISQIAGFNPAISTSLLPGQKIKIPMI